MFLQDSTDGDNGDALAEEESEESKRLLFVLFAQLLARRSGQCIFHSPQSDRVKNSERLSPLAITTPSRTRTIRIDDKRQRSTNKTLAKKHRDCLNGGGEARARARERLNDPEDILDTSKKEYCEKRSDSLGTTCWGLGSFFWNFQESKHLAYNSLV